MSDHLTGFRARLKAGPTAFAAWCGMRDPAVTETILKEGFDCAILDWQHGYHDQTSIESGILVAQAHRKPALVRIGVGDFAGAARFLDWGALGIIAPMINSAADAKTLVDYLKYPPIGGRSWGPTRATGMLGFTNQQQIERGNDATIVIAMIETREGLAALDEILAVPGLDGVFVGPGDLSITLTNGATIDPLHAEVTAALKIVAQKGLAAGKIVSAFCPDGKRAAELVAMGYQLLSVGTDGFLLRSAARAELARAKGG